LVYEARWTRAETCAAELGVDGCSNPHQYDPVNLVWSAFMNFCLQRTAATVRQLTFATIVLVGASLVGAPTHAASLPDTVAKVKRSIVGIGTYEPTRRPPTVLSATGWVVGDGLHVITNAHALKDKDSMKRSESLFVLTSKRAGRKAQVIKVDDVHDIALLRIPGKPLPALRVGKSQAVREGELYAFTGFPLGVILGFYPVTHRGIVSAITPVAIPQSSSRTLSPKMIKRLRKPYNVFQLDATAYPGNSGSPLYSPHDGTVIGVINKVAVKETKESVLSKPSAITYAIPAAFVRALMRSAGLK
jgi:serine protease Do